MIVVLPMIERLHRGLRRAIRARGTATSSPAATEITVSHRCWIVASTSSGR